MKSGWAAVLLTGLLVRAVAARAEDVTMLPVAPRIELASGITYIYRGGAAAAVYRLSESAERDGVEVGIREGVSAVVQPGGSVRDEEVIAAADEHDIAMVLTGQRHFRH